ncbi:MAG TPA: hypothetical protein PLV68_09505, partial [Ilumatobacteraceae bacterium]|nr:hypothetical protein [Ilumatobacteraceae bacterium]
SVAAVHPALTRFAAPLHVVVFGAGPQAVGHVVTLAAVTAAPLASVTFVVRHPNRVGHDVTSLGAVVGADSPAATEAVGRADVVVCATSARTPLFRGEIVASNVIVIAVGSHEPDARELDSALLARSVVVVEDVGAALREAGDVIAALSEEAITRDALIPMTMAISGATPLPPDRPLVFKSVGMSWQDLTVATAILAAA